MISPPHAGEVELHRERLGEQARVAARDARAAALADLDLDDPERLERAQRVARGDAAHAETLGNVLLGAEEIAGPNSFANSASRTSSTICVDMVAERKGMTLRSPFSIAG